MIYCDSLGHLISNESLDELHEFAQGLGLPRRWFQHKKPNHPHYDLTTPSMIHKAVQAGATFVNPQELSTKLMEAKYLQKGADQNGSGT